MTKGFKVDLDNGNMEIPNKYPIGRRCIYCHRLHIVGDVIEDRYLQCCGTDDFTEEILHNN